MQDRYAGDVGDFGKYGLLRALGGSDPVLRLGIIWYLVDPRLGSRDPIGDGRHTGYLSDRQRAMYEDCDPALYAALHAMIESGTRSVAEVERLGVLPPATITHATRLATPRRSMPEAERLELRRLWFEGALRDTAGADRVFLDPDNGLEVASVQRHAARAPKHAYLDELAAIAARDQSLVVYHHLGRTGPHRREIAFRVGQCADALGRDILALRFHRGTSRAFLIAPTAAHAPHIEARITGMLAGPWSRHFERVA